MMPVKKRKNSSSSSQVYSSHQSTRPTSGAGEGSEMLVRKRIKLIDDPEVLPPSPSQVHRSPVGLTDGKDTLENSVVYEERPSEDGFEATVKTVTEAKKLENTHTQSSSVSQAGEQRKSSLRQNDDPAQTHQSAAPQPADDESTGVSSSRKRKRSCSGSADHRWSVSIEEEEERKKKRRRTEDVERASSILGRYRIGKRLGDGGFGVVYKGRRLADGLQVAIKVAEKESSLESIRIPGHPSALPLEVALLILANEDPKVPQIINLLEWEDLPDQYIVVMERPSPCEDLSDFIKGHGGTLSEDDARLIVAQATYAALACCRRGVFHRDIKPDNLLVNPNTLEVKLIDFGCGARLEKSAYTEFCGTRDFFPPEYTTERRYHAKPATVWSLGTTLFKMVCGRLPDASDLQDISWGRWYRPGLSKECCQLIRSLLQRDPSRRMKLRKILRHSWFKFANKSQR